MPSSIRRDLTACSTRRAPRRRRSRPRHPSPNSPRSSPGRGRKRECATSRSLRPVRRTLQFGTAGSAAPSGPDHTDESVVVIQRAAAGPDGPSRDIPTSRLSSSATTPASTPRVFARDMQQSSTALAARAYCPGRRPRSGVCTVPRRRRRRRVTARSQPPRTAATRSHLRRRFSRSFHRPMRPSPWIAAVLVTHPAHLRVREVFDEPLSHHIAHTTFTPSPGQPDVTIAHPPFMASNRRLQDVSPPTLLQRQTSSQLQAQPDPALAMTSQPRGLGRHDLASISPNRPVRSVIAPSRRRPASDPRAGHGWRMVLARPVRSSAPPHRPRRFPRAAGLPTRIVGLVALWPPWCRRRDPSRGDPHGLQGGSPADLAYGYEGP